MDTNKDNEAKRPSLELLWCYWRWVENNSKIYREKSLRCDQINTAPQKILLDLNSDLVPDSLKFSLPQFLNSVTLSCWMTTFLGKSCSFGLPCVSFVNCCQFMYLVISLLVLRAGYGIWLYQFLIIAYMYLFTLLTAKFHLSIFSCISLICL